MVSDTREHLFQYRFAQLKNLVLLHDLKRLEDDLYSGKYGTKVEKNEAS